MNAISPAACLTLIRLRRDGAWPLRFLGRLLGRHDLHPASATLWHELALYRDAEGGYAVAIVARTAAGPVRCHATLTPTLEAALTLLETHDPTQDLCPGSDTASLDNPALSPTALAIQATTLLGAVRDVERRYRIGVGCLLMDLSLLEL